MTTARPHSRAIEEQFQSYLADTKYVVSKAVDEACRSSEVRGVYKNSLATFSVLRVFSKNDLYLVRSAAEIARRIPLLVAAGQISLSYVELRRFTELCVWHPYFREHPVEWNEFRRTPGAGIESALDAPIAYCAHRPLSFYFAYVSERFSEAPLVRSAADELKRRYAGLSTQVHAALGAVGSKSLAMPMAEKSADKRRRLRECQRAVFWAGCVLVTATKPDKLGRLDATERYWFDWLIGRDRSRWIRGYGLLGSET